MVMVLFILFGFLSEVV